MIKDLNITLESIPLNFYRENLKKLDASEFPFTAEEFQQILSSDLHECLFQNQEQDKKEGKTCYTLYVALTQYDKQYFVRMRLVLNETVVYHQSRYLFFVPEVQFVNHLPASDAIRVQCSFDSVYGDKYKSLDADISLLLTEIEKLPVPNAEINKERDKQIWDTYLRALRQKVLQKERIWRIKEINIAKKQIAIQDDETEFFRQKVFDYFGEEGLKSIIFPNDTITYISFSGEHLLSEDERNELIDIAKSFSYKIDDRTPQKLIRCRLQFNQQYNKRKAIVENITNNLRKKGYSHIAPTENKSDFELRYKFRDAIQRDTFVNDLRTLTQEYNGIALRFSDGEQGVTQYVFKRDPLLLENQEKLLNKDLKEEKFVFYTQQEYDQYKKLIETKGEGAQGPDGIFVGTFVKKMDCSLKFEFSDEFIDKLDAIGPKKLLEDGGYIRPVFAGELANIRRMQKAMNKIIRPYSEGYPANWNLANFIFDPKDIREPLMDIEAAKQQILSNPLEKRIIDQPKQIEAVAKAIAAQDLAIIQGPPGTGKTTVIAEIIWQTISQNPDARILITSQTNLAVDNAISRLAGKKNIFPLRSGLLERFEEEGKIYSYSRIAKWLEAKNKQEKEHDNNVIRHWMLDTMKAASTAHNLQTPVTNWKKALDECSESLKLAFYNAYMNHVNVIGATSSESGSNGFAKLCSSLFHIDEDKEPEFDLVIMDEASKATPPELILPLTLGKKVIVIGDHKQLPPMIDDKDFAEAMEAIGEKELAKELSKKESKISQFEKLFVNAPDFAKVSLDTQFRMHEKIMNCIKQFYEDQKEFKNNGLICGIQKTQDNPDLQDKSSRFHGLNSKLFIMPDTHVIWVDVNSPERKKEGSTSFYNDGEIEAVKKVLQLLMKADGFEKYMSSFSKEDEREIGIITYYAAQKNELERALKDINLPLRINTVDKFQGMERNIVIVSTVRSNRAIIGNNKEQPNNFELGFAKELPRINVGFSRAKRLLIVVGNRLHFEKNKKEYKKAIQQMEYISFNTLQNL